MRLIALLRVWRTRRAERRREGRSAEADRILQGQPTLPGSGRAGSNEFFWGGGW